MSSIQVLSRTQKIIVNPDSSVSIINSGPIGPGGPGGPAGYGLYRWTGTAYVLATGSPTYFTYAIFVGEFDPKTAVGGRSVNGDYWLQPDPSDFSVGGYVRHLQAAMYPDLLIVGAITRDVNGAATSAPVVWPDGTVGVYTATTVSTVFPGAVDAYTITYGSPVTKTYTQPAVTRNFDGAVTARPAMVVT